MNLLPGWLPHSNTVNLLAGGFLLSGLLVVTRRRPLEVVRPEYKAAPVGDPDRDPHDPLSFRLSLETPMSLGQRRGTQLLMDGAAVTRHYRVRHDETGEYQLIEDRLAATVDGKGDVTGTHQLWRTRDSTYVPTPVLHEGRLYVVTDQGFALCLDAKSGELLFKERLPGASATGRGVITI